MSVSKTNETGFGMTGGLIAIAAALTVGVIGVIVYEHKQSVHESSAPSVAQTTQQEPTSNTTQPQQTAATTNEVQIPELGISVTVSDTVKDLSYKTVSNVGAPSVAAVDLSTARLTGAEPICGSNGISTALGRLGKANGQYPSDSSQASGKLIKQFSGFYISYVAPQASCGVNNARAEQLLESQRAALQSSLTANSIQAL